MNGKRGKKHKVTALSNAVSDLITAGGQSKQNSSPEFLRWLSETFGTDDRALQSRLLCEAVGAVPDFIGKEIQTFDYVSAAIRGVRPHDSLEGMLATEMVAVHTIAMTLMERAVAPTQSDLGLELNINRAVKLMRMLVLQMAALGRYRGKGEQKVTVEHVHVYRGGKAIVGAVMPNTGASQSKKG
jgi:hypothetical protein